MFLTNPTVEELQALDLPVLLDMLSYQSAIHSKLAKSDGTSGIADTSQQLIINIQTAIQRKKRLEKNSTLIRTKTSGNSR
jgi:hypothetical protein